MKKENDAAEIGFPMTLTSGAFLNQKPNKQTMNNRSILIAAVFHKLYIQWKKTVKTITRLYKTPSASAISNRTSHLQPRPPNPWGIVGKFIINSITRNLKDLLQALGTDSHGNYPSLISCPSMNRYSSLTNDSL